MKHRVTGWHFVLSAIAPFVLCACDARTSEQSEGSNPGPAKAPSRDVVATPPVEVDVPETQHVADTSSSTYVRAISMHDTFEIKSSYLALERSKSKEVRALARLMIADHSRTRQELRDAISGAKLTYAPAQSLDASRNDMLNALRNANDKTFNQLFWRQQMSAHQRALKLHSSYAANGDEPVLRRLALQTAPKVQRHLEKLRAME